MASSAVDIGTGATLAFGTSSYSAEILSIEWSGIERAAVDVTHLGSVEEDDFGGREFIPVDLVNAGELTFEIHLNPDTDPPIDAAPEEITLTFQEGATWVATGFLTGLELSVPLEDKMVGTVTVKFTGGVNITAAV